VNKLAFDYQDDDAPGDGAPGPDASRIEADGVAGWAQLAQAAQRLLDGVRAHRCNRPPDAAAADACPVPSCDAPGNSQRVSL